MPLMHPNFIRLVFENTAKCSNFMIILAIYLSKYVEKSGFREVKYLLSFSW